MQDDPPASYCLPILPWLHLDSEVDLGQARAIPVDVRAPERTLPELSGVRDDLIQVLGSFRCGNRPIGQCAALLPIGWSLSGTPTDNSISECHRLADLLMLAAFAENEYGVAENWWYTSNNVFDLYFPRFTSPPGPFLMTYRRRDGVMREFTRFGQSIFSLPLETEMRFALRADPAFARALGSLAPRDQLTNRLRLALPLFGLANTFPATITEDTELVLLATAFDGLLSKGQGGGKTEKFASALAAPLAPFEQITAADPRAATRSSALSWSPKDACYPLRYLWAREFYTRRNMLAHGQDPCSKKDWRWQQWEHLAMGSFVFPLLVKLLLADSCSYQLTMYDMGRCDAVDALLAETNWFSARADPGQENDGPAESVWTATLLAAMGQRERREGSDFTRRFREQNL